MVADSGAPLPMPASLLNPMIDSFFELGGMAIEVPEQGRASETAVRQPGLRIDRRRADD